MKRILTNILIITFFISCTENPFFDDNEIKDNTKFKINGQVRLEDSNDHSGISVYVEKLDLFTKTDRQGRFQFELPLHPKLNEGNNFTGFLKIYYYVSNYQLETSTIFMNEGEFAYGMADLDKDGRINEHLILGKLLDVKTSINPGKIKSNYDGFVQIEVRLENKVDSVIVFTHFAKDKELASAFLKSKDDMNDVIHMLSLPSNFVATVIDSVKFWTMDVDWSFHSQSVDIGKYEAIPYLFVYQENVPDELLIKYGDGAVGFSPDFINVPFRRKTADFEITPESD